MRGTDQQQSRMFSYISARYLRTLGVTVIAPKSPTPYC